MKKAKIFAVILVSITIFLLVYYPHYNSRFPRHIDEWHHIAEAKRFQSGEYVWGSIGYRAGFHVLLMFLSKAADLVLIYQYLPAVWAVVSGLVLLYVAYKKTGGRFDIALFAMIFFASIKSNVNITGLWFFTPLSFSIPFIFLYVYFLTEGIEKRNKKYIIISVAIMAMLLPIHAISVLFAVPFMLIYAMYNLGFIKKELRFFSIFLIIPAIGLFFYKYSSGVAWSALFGHLTNAVQFKRGWGVLELRNSPLELYSAAGYLLAAIGAVRILMDKSAARKYLAYILWPVTVFILIAVFRATEVSYLSPYQRNLYYFAISLPFLSAFGLEGILRIRKEAIGRAVIIVIITVFAFKGYFYTPRQIELYDIIDEDEYKALLFLENLPEKGKVMVIPRIGVALYAVSGHWPIATYSFYTRENRRDVEMFFSPRTTSAVRQELLDKYRPKYILSKSRIEGGWRLIYKDDCYIYDVD